MDRLEKWKTATPWEMQALLKAYEDTGLTPEEIRDTQAALAEAVGVLEFISFQPCENSKNAVAFGSCLQSNDCLTEYCLPCYAKAYIQSPAAKAAGERMRAMERVVEAARAYTCNPGNRLDHYHRLCAAVAAYEMEVAK